MGRALAGLQRSLEQGSQLVVRGQDIQRVTDTADNSHEQIVEIMGHAAGQYSDALELLAVMQHLLRTALVLHIGKGPQPFDRAPFLHQGKGPDQLPARTLAGGQDFSFHLQRRHRFECRTPGHGDSRHVLGRNIVQPAPSNAAAGAAPVNLDQRSLT